MELYRSRLDRQEKMGEKFEKLINKNARKNEPNLIHMLYRAKTLYQALRIRDGKQIYQ